MASVEMTSRERIQAAARGLPLDRVPVFFWINAHAGARLMARFRPSRHPSWNALARLAWSRFDRPDPAELWRLLPLAFDVHTFNFANAYGLELGSDMVLASYATPWSYTKIYREGGRFLMRDLYGVTRALGHGIYPDMIAPAITDVRGLKDYSFPDPSDPRLYNVFRRLRAAWPGASIAAEVWGSQDFVSTSLIGMERFMMWLVDYPDEIKAFMRRWSDHHIQVLRNSVKAGADVVFIEDDYGYDNRPLISMTMWKEFTYPELRRLIDAAHEAGALAVLHSCGYQMPFLEHYAAAGLDMLQSFQPQAGNDFKSAYEQYGGRLAFITGIDIQRGESMSADELKQEIIANYRLAGKKGRHVLATTHEIQHTMPEANVRAIFDTVAAIQRGEYD
jgi:uroporphyrinogen decarboxylase